MFQCFSLTTGLYPLPIALTSLQQTTSGGQAIHLGPYKSGPGELNVPVSVGGMIIRPGDFIVGDDDGVVAFPPERAASLLTEARALEREESELLQQIAEDTYHGGY